MFKSLIDQTQKQLQELNQRKDLLEQELRLVQNEIAYNNRQLSTRAAIGEACEKVVEQVQDIKAAINAAFKDNPKDLEAAMTELNNQLLKNPGTPQIGSETENSSNNLGEGVSLDKEESSKHPNESVSLDKEESPKHPDDELNDEDKTIETIEVQASTIPKQNEGKIKKHLESMTVNQLKGFCDDNKIPYKPKIRKLEIITLLLNKVIIKEGIIVCKDSKLEEIDF